MNLAERLARRRRIREDLGTLVGIAVFVLAMLTIIVLPGILTDEASSVAIWHGIP